MGWLIGLGLAIVGGGIASPVVLWLFLKWIECHEKQRAKRPDPNPVGVRLPYAKRDSSPFSGWFIGAIERSVICALVALGAAPSMVIAMTAWIGLKMVANWGRRKSEHLDYGPVSMAALAGGIISVGFGYVGGLVVAADGQFPRVGYPPPTCVCSCVAPTR